MQLFEGYLEIKASRFYLGPGIDLFQSFQQFYNLLKNFYNKAETMSSHGFACDIDPFQWIIESFGESTITYMMFTQTKWKVPKY